SSSSSTRRCARRPDSKGRCPSARSTATRSRARSSARCLPRARACPGRTRCSSSRGRAKWMPRRSSTISRRCRGGSSSRTRDRSAAGRKTTMTPTTVAPQLTVRAIVLAIILAMILAAANTYLGLFAGLTIASAIPAAVVSMAVLRVLGGGGILENNIVQTGGSAGASLASGVIFTIPALVILGHWSEFEYLWVLAIAALGGLLGVLFSVPLRRSLIVDQGLTFPEGNAAAEVLKAGENPAQGVKILGGAALGGGALKLAAASGLGLVPDTAAIASYFGKSIAYVGTNL